jgi:hypothetical protein
VKGQFAAEFSITCCSPMSVAVACHLLSPFNLPQPNTLVRLPGRSDTGDGPDSRPWAGISD